MYRLFTDQIEIPRGNVGISAVIELIVGAKRVYLQGKCEDILTLV